MQIDLSSLHPAFQAAFRPLIVSAVSEPEEEQEEDPEDEPAECASPYWSNSADWKHDVRRDWKLED